jgi:hypothetical protein
VERMRFGNGFSDVASRVGCREWVGSALFSFPVCWRCRCWSEGVRGNKAYGYFLQTNGHHLILAGRWTLVFSLDPLHKYFQILVLEVQTVTMGVDDEYLVRHPLV